MATKKIKILLCAFSKFVGVTSWLRLVAYFVQESNYKTKRNVAAVASRSKLVLNSRDSGIEVLLTAWPLTLDLSNAWYTGGGRSL